jgi:hypothetical protein
MPIGVAIRFTGVVYVTRATGRKQVNVSEGSQHYSALAIRKRKSVRFADSRPRNKPNWMYCLLMGIYAIRLWVI